MIGFAPRQEPERRAIDPTLPENSAEAVVLLSDATLLGRLDECGDAWVALANAVLQAPLGDRAAAKRFEAWQILKERLEFEALMRWQAAVRQTISAAGHSAAAPGVGEAASANGHAGAANTPDHEQI